jgi:uncharacterized protein (DUF983 family)
MSMNIKNAISAPLSKEVQAQQVSHWVARVLGVPLPLLLLAALLVICPVLGAVLSYVWTPNLEESTDT